MNKMMFAYAELYEHDINQAYANLSCLLSVGELKELNIESLERMVLMEFVLRGNALKPNTRIRIKGLSCLGDIE